MKKATIALLIMAAAILVGCESMSKSKDGIVSELTQANFLHRNWVLERVNGDAITVLDGMSAPNIEVGENFTVNGNNGCNRYFGQGELMGNRFRIDKMGSTMMACPEEATMLEMAMSSVLKDWSEVTLTKDRLVLSNDTYTLDFVLRDWVN